jgi:hypothetical protein
MNIFKFNLPGTEQWKNCEDDLIRELEAFGFNKHEAKMVIFNWIDYTFHNMGALGLNLEFLRKMTCFKKPE